MSIINAGTLIPSLPQLVQGAGEQSVSKPLLLLITMMPDDSGSIRSYGNTQAIIRGHNLQLDASRDRPNMLLRTRYLNGYELFGYRKPEEAVRMDLRNYVPLQSTPLYDQTFELMGEVLRGTDSYSDRHDVYTMTCILTDGADTSSRNKSPDDVKAVVERMLASGRHVVAGLGVRDRSTDFFKVFRSMGIPEQWIMVLEREENDIVRGMSEFYQSSREVNDAASFRTASRTGYTRSSISLRTPAENGEAPAADLPWEPAPLSYEVAKSPEGGGWSAVASPMTWDGTSGFYTLRMPDEHTAVIIGRDSADRETAVKEQLLGVFKGLMARYPNLRIVYVPLRIKNENRSDASRLHALIAPVGAKNHSIRAIHGDTVVLTSDAPSEDKRLKGGRKESSDIEDGNRVKLARDVVFLFRGR